MNKNNNGMVLTILEKSVVLIKRSLLKQKRRPLCEIRFTEDLVVSLCVYEC